MTNHDNKAFKNSTKCWICDNTYIDTDVKVKDCWYDNEKYRKENIESLHIKIVMSILN